MSDHCIYRKGRETVPRGAGRVAGAGLWGQEADGGPQDGVTMGWALSTHFSFFILSLLP